MGTEETVFLQAQRSLERQEASLAELRSRTSVLLAAGGLVAGLFGRTEVQRGLGGFGVLALGFFAVTAALCISVLFPKRGGWTFVVDARNLITHHLDVPERNDPAKLFRFLADHFQGYYLSNRIVLEFRYGLFWWACVALAVDVALWILAAAIG